MTGNLFGKGTEGPQLLKEMGERTKALTPKLIHVPTVTVDGSQEGQAQILQGFKRFLCEKVLVREKPSECTGYLNIK